MYDQTSLNPIHLLPSSKNCRCKPSPFFILTLSSLFLSLVLATPYVSNFTSNRIKLTILFQHLKYRVLHKLFLPQEHQSFILPPSTCVLWMAPFLSGGGYCSEAWSYINSLQLLSENPALRLSIEHHGDGTSFDFWNGLPEEFKRLAFKLHKTRCPMNDTIVICHSEPGAWDPPLFETSRCPPHGHDEAAAVIGRTMFETDRLTPEHVRRCNRMDSIWVPTEFHVSTFAKSGVEASKIVKVVQPVDTTFFNPGKHEPFDLPMPAAVRLLSSSDSGPHVKQFVFLSIFKWETRKGWDVLLKAFLQEFSKKDAVVLYLLTNPYHMDGEFHGKIFQLIRESGIEEPDDGWAPIYVIDSHIPQTDLPRMYRAANAFVFPTRGEGWGRPLVEAMAMSLPVIATNWSGPTEYLNEDNGYLLPVDHFSEVKEGPFRGHLWAEPSVQKLRELMRHVMHRYGEARQKGVKARTDMIQKFAPNLVGNLVADQIIKLSRKKLQKSRLKRRTN